jgi:hypothetical protein
MFEEGQTGWRMAWDKFTVFLGRYLCYITGGTDSENGKFQCVSNYIVRIMRNRGKSPKETEFFG